MYNAAAVLILETLIFLGILKCLSKKIIQDSLIVTEFRGRHKLKHKMNGMFYMAFVAFFKSVNAGVGLCSSSKDARQNSCLQPHIIFNISFQKFMFLMSHFQLINGVSLFFILVSLRFYIQITVF